MRVAAVSVLFAVLAVAIYLNADINALARWAAGQQRALQNEMAAAVWALRAGTPGAWAALLAAAGAYGFVHAVGPGHGKYLIGGVGLGASVGASRLLGVAIASSLAQALWAIILVYGGFLLLEVSARRMTALAEDYLAPVSYIAIAAIGALLVGRGARALSRQFGPKTDRGGQHHVHGECGCRAHGPSPEEVAKLGSMRDAVALIASIAIRPCTGAVFLLVIAWQMDIRGVGAVAVLVMGLGTAALTSLVAISSIAARGIAFASAGKTGSMALAIPALQIAAGALIMWTSLVLLGYAVG